MKPLKRILAVLLMSAALLATAMSGVSQPVITTQPQDNLAIPGETITPGGRVIAWGSSNSGRNIVPVSLTNVVAIADALADALLDTVQEILDTVTETAR
jgi:hypothetical protein